MALPPEIARPCTSSGGTSTSKLTVSLRPCSYCHRDENIPELYGRMYHREKLSIHFFCMLLSQGLECYREAYEGIEGFLIEDVLINLTMHQPHLCIYCKSDTANLVCYGRKCKKRFHLPCGLANGANVKFFNPYMAYCISCRNYQKFDNVFLSNKGNHTCPICLDTFADSRVYDLFKPTCCKTVEAIHLRCLKLFALNAGNNFACPCCKKKRAFLQSVKNWGVFIPKYDALYSEHELYIEE